MFDFISNSKTTELHSDDSHTPFEKGLFSVGWPWECTLYTVGTLEPYKLLLFPSACCALINKTLQRSI